MVFNRFLVRLGVVLAPFLAPKLVQNRLKIASRRFLGPFFFLFKNADFHADLRFPTFFHQNRPQDEAKIGLRSPQDGSKTVLKSFFFDVEICLRFWSVLDSVLVAFGAPLGAKLAPKSKKKSNKNRPVPPDRPKTAQEHTKTAPRAPKRHPKGAQEHPRGTQKHPKEAQEHPEGTQESEESEERQHGCAGCVGCCLCMFRLWSLCGLFWAVRAVSVALGFRGWKLIAAVGHGLA